ncbi:MAG: hypothetical protein ACOCSA_03125 [Candidatus Hadarchaeota archaeon]
MKTILRRSDEMALFSYSDSLNSENDLEEHEEPSPESKEEPPKYSIFNGDDRYCLRNR